MISQLGDNFDLVTTSYIEDFKKYMKARSRIPTPLVQKHDKDVFFIG